MIVGMTESFVVIRLLMGVILVIALVSLVVSAVSRGRLQKFAYFLSTVSFVLMFAYLVIDDPWRLLWFAVLIGGLIAIDAYL